LLGGKPQTPFTKQMHYYKTGKFHTMSGGDDVKEQRFNTNLSAAIFESKVLDE